MASKIEKTIARLQEAIQEGNYYEAHQQLRTIASRYVKQTKYDDAVNVLISGAQSLLGARQGGSGGDLCLFLVDVYKTAEKKPDTDSKGKAITLLRAFPSEEPSRKRFITELLAWSSKFGEYPTGDPELHHVAGSLYADEGEPYDAERHLTLGTKDSPEPFVRLEYDWYAQDESHTAALYAARSVLPYLLVGNVRDATRSLQLFTSRLDGEKNNLSVQDVSSANAEIRIFPSLPLLNFLGLLLLAVQRGAADTFRQLRSHYAVHIKDAAGWDEALDHIGEMCFGIQIRRQANPLMDMMGSLFGGGGGPVAPQPKSRRVEGPTPPAVDLD